MSIFNMGLYANLHIHSRQFSYDISFFFFFFQHWKPFVFVVVHSAHFTFTTLLSTKILWETIYTHGMSYCSYVCACTHYPKKKVHNNSISIKPKYAYISVEEKLRVGVSVCVWRIYWANTKKNCTNIRKHAVTVLA